MSSQKNKETQKKVRKMLSEMRLFDDTFFSVVFEKRPKCVEVLLRAFIGRDDLIVDRVKTQVPFQNLHGRSVRLDVFARDKNGKCYDIEIQRASSGATLRRARYNRALMDANVLIAGEDFSKLPESYVIFFTETDVLGDGKAKYEIVSAIKETGKVVDDGTHVIYINGAYKGNDPLGSIIKDMLCKDPQDMQNNVLRDALEHFKFNEKGASYMCDIMEKCIAEERAEVFADAVGAMAAMVKKAIKKTNEDPMKVMEDMDVPQNYRGEILKFLQNEK